MGKRKLDFEVPVHQLDCREGLELLDDDAIDLVVTSPPYDDLRSYNDSSKWNFDVFKKVAEILFRKMTPGGSDRVEC